MDQDLRAAVESNIKLAAKIGAVTPTHKLLVPCRRGGLEPELDTARRIAGWDVGPRAVDVGRTQRDCGILVIGKRAGDTERGTADVSPGLPVAPRVGRDRRTRV